MKSNKKTKSFRIHIIGLSLMLMSLSACVTPNVTNKIVPVYSATFLAGVAQEYENEKYGPYTKEVIRDWMMLVGL